MKHIVRNFEKLDKPGKDYIIDRLMCEYREFLRKHKLKKIENKFIVKG